MTNTNKKVALVTGANKGLGFEMSRQLAQKGIKVLMAARNAESGKSAVKKMIDQNGDCEFVQLDITKSNDIAAIKKYIEQHFGKLDILINNAGIETDGGWGSNNVTTIDIAAIRKTFDTNFFGTVELTQALLPLLEKSEGGRIVNMSSIMGSLTLHADSTSPIYGSKPFGYNASKTALNQFTVHLAAALDGTKVKVNSAHPGWVKTDLGGEYAPMDVETGSKTGIELALLDENGPNGLFIHMGETLPW